MIEMVKLKRDGSLVIPRPIRQALGLTTSEPLVLVTDHETLLLKRVSQSQFRRQLRTLTHTWHRRFRQAHLHPRDIDREIEAARRPRR